MGTDVLGELRRQTPRLVDELAALVSVESPSEDPDATARCIERSNELAADRIGSLGQVVMAGGRSHVSWRFGEATRVLLLGHLDTVWPTGTLSRWPFAVDGDRATGPGAFDMKAGVVQLFAALSLLDDLDGVGVLLTTDEEIGSPASAELIEDSARGALAALVLEPSAGGAVKTARKGVSMYTVEVTGRAAHAGLEPEKGANTTVEASHLVLRIVELADPAAGTTVTPTVLSSGTTRNTIPAAAELAIDVRVTTAEEQARVDAGLNGLAATVTGISLRLVPGPRRPPMPASSSTELYGFAREVAVQLGLGALEGVAVGGGSDGNLTAGIGVPTLDGLGAVGDGAHAEGEWVSVASMAERAALLAGIVRRTLDREV